VLVVLLANPASGSGPDPDALARGLERRGARVARIDLADSARAAGLRPDRVVVAGGDGSLGPAAEAAAACGADLAVIPAGTANDLATSLGLPGDEEAAIALATELEPRRTEIDLARADGRPFLNAVSYGLAADAAEIADGLKDRLGSVAYPAGALAAGLRGDPFGVRVRVDGDPFWDGEAWQVIVAGTGAFGAGSGLDAAEAGDRRLDVAVVPGGSRAALARRAAGLRRGNLTEQDDVPHARGRVVEVQAGSAAANIDGELVDPGPARMETGRERVRVIVP